MQDVETLNLLPADGIVNYYGLLFSNYEADRYQMKLMDEIPWENDRHIIFGREIITKRKMAWFGDKPFTYTYSHIPRKAHPWIPVLQELKKKIEEKTGESFNSCLLNLYHSGEEGMGWHADDEKELKPNGAIASLSFGAERKFVFKHKTTAQLVQTTLAHGSLLVMKGRTQVHWLHRLPVTKKVSLPRINLTFRTILS